MKLAEELGSSTHRYFALGGLARAHAPRGEWKAAAPRAFEEAIAFQNEAGIGRELEGLDRASLAQALFALGQPERARALDSDSAVDPLLARCEMLIAETGASSYGPHLMEIRAERSRRRGDVAAWHAALAEAHRLFVKTATGHAFRLARELESS